MLLSQFSYIDPKTFDKDKRKRIAKRGKVVVNRDGLLIHKKTSKMDVKRGTMGISAGTVLEAADNLKKRNNLQKSGEGLLESIQKSRRPFASDEIGDYRDRALNHNIKTREIRDIGVNRRRTKYDNLTIDQKINNINNRKQMRFTIAKQKKAYLQSKAPTPSVTPTPTPSVPQVKKPFLNKKTLAIGGGLAAAGVGTAYLTNKLRNRNNKRK